MVKSKTIEYSYDYPWELVVAAYEDKFWKLPNEDLPDVLEVHFQDFEVDMGTGVTRFKRWGRFRMALPNWVLKMAGGPDSIVLTSETTIDRPGRLLVSTGANKTFRDRLALDERTTFRADPENPNRTLLILEGTIEIKVSLMGWMISAIENAIINQYSNMTGKGREVERKQIARLDGELRERKEEPGMTKSERIARSLAADAGGLPKLPAGAAGLPGLGFPLLTAKLSSMLDADKPDAVSDSEGGAEEVGSDTSSDAGGAEESKGEADGAKDRVGGRRRSLSGSDVTPRSRGPSLTEASDELSPTAASSSRRGSAGAGSDLDGGMVRSFSVGASLNAGAAAS